MGNAASWLTANAPNAKFSWRSSDGIHPITGWNVNYIKALPFVNLCAQAAKNDSVFASFKSHPSYNDILEHTSVERAGILLSLLASTNPFLLRKALWSAFLRNDGIGGPRRQVGRIQPLGRCHRPHGVEIVLLLGIIWPRRDDEDLRLAPLDGQQIITRGPPEGRDDLVFTLGAHAEWLRRRQDIVGR